MARKLIESKSITGAAFSADVDPDTYDAFMLRVTGTQAAGNFVGIGEVGHVTYKHGSETIVDVDFDILHFYNELKGGDVECTGEANGAAFAFSVFIPRGYLDTNRETVETTDRATVALQYGANVATHLASGTVELYGITREIGEENYGLYLIQYNQDFSAASRQRLRIAQDNVIGLYTDRGFGLNYATAKASLAASANFTELGIKKDNLESGNIAVGVHQSHSNWENRIEASYVRMFENELASPGEVGEQLSDDVWVTTVTSGAVVVRHLAVSAVFNSAKREATVDATKRVLESKIAKKIKAGKLEEIETLRQIGVAVG